LKGKAGEKEKFYFPAEELFARKVHRAGGLPKKITIIRRRVQPCILNGKA
jgi:hypothetical protein